MVLNSLTCGLLSTPCPRDWEPYFSPTLDLQYLLELLGREDGFCFSCSHAAACTSVLSLSELVAQADVQEWHWICFTTMALVGHPGVVSGPRYYCWT